jgi:hypothetical protein
VQRDRLIASAALASSGARSPVHGMGLFALRPIAAGERVIEYKGELTSWRRTAARERSEAGHTFVLQTAANQQARHDIDDA